VKRRRWALLALLYMAAIFALSSVPDDKGSAVSRTVLFLPPKWQNLLHVPMFFGVAWLWSHATTKGNALLIAVVYGALDEMHQYYVPGRFASWTDALLDALGGILCYLWLIYRDRTR